MSSLIERLARYGLAGARRTLTRAFVTIAGFTVLLLGIVMIVTPGPAIVLIPGGLAILALEYAWARRTLDKVKAYIKSKRGVVGTGAEE